MYFQNDINNPIEFTVVYSLAEAMIINSSRKRMEEEFINYWKNKKRIPSFSLGFSQCTKIMLKEILILIKEILIDLGICKPKKSNVSPDNILVNSYILGIDDKETKRKEQKIV